MPNMNDWGRKGSTNMTGAIESDSLTWVNIVLSVNIQYGMLLHEIELTSTRSQHKPFTHLSRTKLNLEKIMK